MRRCKDRGSVRRWHYDAAPRVSEHRRVSRDRTSHQHINNSTRASEFPSTLSSLALQLRQHPRGETASECHTPGVVVHSGRHPHRRLR